VGAITGAVLLGTDSGAYPSQKDAKGNVINGSANCLVTDPKSGMCVKGSGYAYGPSPDYYATSQRRNAGMMALLIGAPIAAAGLTMILVGIQPAAAAGDEAPPPAARLVPEVRVGLASGSLTWRF
jgi:hypothetical protein